MTTDDIKKLRFITAYGSTIRYSASIPDKECSRKFYYPICFSYFFKKCLMLADYSDIAEEYLKTSTINLTTVTNIFIRNLKLKYHDISLITLDQAQEIINKNVLLFNEITRLVKENELISQINTTV